MLERILIQKAKLVTVAWLGDRGNRPWDSVHISGPSSMSSPAFCCERQESSQNLIVRYLTEYSICNTIIMEFWSWEGYERNDI